MYRVIMKNIDGAGQNDLLVDEFPTVDTAIAAGRKIWNEVNVDGPILGTFIESSGGWYVAIDEDLVSMVVIFRDGFLAP